MLMLIHVVYRAIGTVTVTETETTESESEPDRVIHQIAVNSNASGRDCQQNCPNCHWT